jgi:hypothetical protein
MLLVVVDWWVWRKENDGEDSEKQKKSSVESP